MNYFFRKHGKMLFILFCIFSLLLWAYRSDSELTASVPSSTNSPATEYPVYNGTMYSTSTCPICGGSGLCPQCNGEGRIYIGGTNDFTDGYVDCPGCYGSGQCFRCNGTGVIPVH